MFYDKNMKKNNLERILWFVLLSLIFCLVLSLSLRKITEIDIGFHLRGGKWMLENKAFHKNDVFTYTVNNNEYIAMYWLFQIVIYLIYKISSYEGIVIFNAILIQLIYFLILLRMFRNKTHSGIIAILLFISVFPFELRFTVRPEVFTYIFLSLTLFILEEYYYRKKNYLFIIPFINLLWVNFHGLYILSWGVILSYFLGILIHNKKIDKSLLKYGLISIFICLVNPYFIKGITFPFYLFTRLQSGNVFKSVISEFISPWAIRKKEIAPFVQQGQVYVYYFLSLFTLLITLITIKKRKFHEIAIISIFFILSSMAIRNIPLFLVASIPYSGIFLNEILVNLKNLKRFKRISYKYFTYFISIPASIIVIVFILRVLTNDYYFSKRTNVHFGIGLEENLHPVKAAQFLCDNNLYGRILNDLNSGSWLIWKGPQKVFIDGRLEVMREKFFKEYRISFDYKDGLKILIEKYKPDIILFNYDVSLKWFLQLKNFNDFRMVYCDINTAIFVRKGYRDDLKDVNIMEIVYKMGLDTIITEKEEWDILKIKRKSKFVHFFESLYKKQVYPYELINLGVFAYQSNNFKASIILHLEFLKKTGGRYYETYFNLGAMYLRNKEFSKSLYCYRKTLEMEPKNKMAQDRINELNRILKINK